MALTDAVKKLVGNDSKEFITSDNFDSLLEVKHFYPMDCAPIDIPLGGGVPSGRIIEVYGWESTAKTTWCLEMAKAFVSYWEAQGQEAAVLWVESESTFDRVRAKYIGLDPKNLIVFPTLNIEEAYKKKKYFLEMAKKNKVKLFIVHDTIAATKTTNELEKGQWGGGMQEKPRVIGNELTKIVNLIGETDSTLVYSNQVYDGGYSGLISKGGQAIKYYSSIRLQTSREGDLADPATGNIIGIWCTATTKKNKLMIPKQVIHACVHGEKGIDRFETLYRFLCDKKLITISGSWKSVNFNGKEYKFQNTKKLKDIIEHSEPMLLNYFNYLVYEYYSKISVLFKTRTIKKLWELEESLYDKRLTKLTDDEVEIATTLLKGIKKENDSIK